MIEFSPFRLDVEDERLFRRDRPIKLRPKTWHVLRYLAERPGRLVTTTELLDAVWPDVEVTPGALTQSIVELRRALADDAHTPRFIQTVHRRGFRFIAQVHQSPAQLESQSARARNLPPFPAFRTSEGGKRSLLFGRESELHRLDELLQEARAGRRQFGFITGEPGIGKTSVLQTYLERLAEDKADEPVWIAGGRCVELHGEREAFLPIMEALDRLAHEAGEELLVPTLRRCAPSWLAQLPWLLAGNETERTAAVLARITPARMLREFCVAMEALTAQGTLVLWLEDLHWCDPSTVDLLSILAARPEPARLLVLLTYRPVDAATHSHPIAPLKRSLLQQHACEELALEYLDETAIGAYLRERLETEPEPALATLIHEHTEGNPLFVVTLVNHLINQGWLAHANPQTGWRLTLPLESLREKAPESLRELVEAQLAHMDADEVEVLQAGSAAGDTFAAQAVAAVTGRDVDAVEGICGRLATRERFVEASGPGLWPDGSAGERYRFLHTAFRHILYGRMAAGERQRVHQRIAARLEGGYASQPGERAAELALHFERGGDPERAVHYYGQAAAGVRQRCGDREAVAYFQRALTLLATLPESGDRDRRELELRMHLWREVNASGAVSAVEQDGSLERALQLCDRIGDARSRAYAASYLTRSLIIECELDAAESVEPDRVQRASSLGDPVLLAAAHNEVGDIALYRGELDRAQRELAPCISAMEGVDPPETCRALGHDPATLAWGRLGSWTHWLQGRPEEARRDAAACLARGEACDHPLNRAFSMGCAILMEQFRRDAGAAEPLVKSFAELVEEYGFDLPYPEIYALMGWRLAQRAEIDAASAQLREGLAASRRTGAREGLSLLLAVLAETELLRGDAQEGLAAIAEARAFVEATGERLWEAEIHRLNGELLRLDGEDAAAEASFQAALDVACGQGARALELRATTSLARLWKDTRRTRQAHALLAGIYGTFTEGFDTLDVRDAKALLDSL